MWQNKVTRFVYASVIASRSRLLHRIDRHTPGINVSGVTGWFSREHDALLKLQINWIQILYYFAETYGSVKTSCGSGRGEGKKKRKQSNKNSTLRHGKVNPPQKGRRHWCCRQKIKVHSSPKVIYGVLDFRARVCPALMNSIDSIFLATAFPPSP